MQTKVVHKSKAPFDVYIGRPSIWGNPFPLHENTTRDRVMRAYVEWVVKQPRLMRQVGELRGKTLGCWCAPKRCHGDALALLADGVSPNCLDLFI